MYSKIKENILDLFFPPHCVVCNRIGSFFCNKCSKEIINIREQTCPKCNRISDRGKYCPRCRSKADIAGIFATGYFKDDYLKEAIHKYKYEGIAALAPIFADKMGKIISDKKIGFDYIAFTPASKKRETWRGYNQAELLAKELSKKFEKPILIGLQKTKDTKTQVGLPKREREKNLKTAFSYHGTDITGKRVLIVDDVVTTGTTLNECAHVLKENGARIVWGAVIAKE